MLSAELMLEEYLMFEAKNMNCIKYLIKKNAKFNFIF